MLVTALVILAGTMIGLGNLAKRWTIQKQTRLAFSGWNPARAGPKRWSPLQRLHPKYEDWLKKTGSKRSAQLLETQQWILGLVVCGAFHEMTGKWLVPLVLGSIAFAYPVLQVRVKLRQIRREMQKEMRKLILLLRIYVKAGQSNLQAVRLAQHSIDGPLRDVLQDAEKLMMHMTFEEVMNLLAKNSPSEELEVVARALKNGAKTGSEISGNLSNALDDLNHNDRLNLNKFREQQRRSGYMKFMAFFITPLILDVGFYVWVLISGTFHTFS